MRRAATKLQAPACRCYLAVRQLCISEKHVGLSSVSKKDRIDAAVRRLKGTWRSDKKKTESRWVFPKRIAGKRLGLWKSMFGKNEWRFAKNHVHVTFEGVRSSAPYRVLWADEWSAIPVLGRGRTERAYHVHFDGQWFYILAGRDIVEYFRRVPNKRLRSA